MKRILGTNPPRSTPIEASVIKNEPPPIRTKERSFQRLTLRSGDSACFASFGDTPRSESLQKNALQVHKVFTLFPMSPG